MKNKSEKNIKETVSNMGSDLVLLQNTRKTETGCGAQHRQRNPRKTFIITFMFWLALLLALGFFFFFSLPFSLLLKLLLLLFLFRLLEFLIPVFLSFFDCTRSWLQHVRSSFSYVCISVCVLVTRSCLTLCDSMDYSPLGSSVHGILQARILEWVDSPFSRGSSQPRDWTWVSCIAGRFFTIWATKGSPDQGSNSGCLHWKYRVSGPRPPGKSHRLLVFF